MGVIGQKRKIIIEEMEKGRGSAKIFSHPVSLEPPFRPFGLREEHNSFLKRLFSNMPDNSRRIAEKSPDNQRFLFIRITPSTDDKNTLITAEQFILSLPASNPISFEIIGHNRRIFFQITVKENQVNPVLSQLRSHFPNAEAHTEKDYIRTTFSSRPYCRAYRLKNSHFFPLCIDDKIDPFRPLFGFLGNLSKAQAGAFQILFTPVRHNWQENMRQASRNPYDPKLSVFFDLPNLPKIVDDKISRPLYAVSIRMIASDKNLLQSMETFFNQFQGENGIIPVAGEYPHESIIERNSHVHGIILNLTELAYFIHLPSPELIESLPYIEQARKCYPVPSEFTSNGPVLGFNMYQGIKTPVCHSCSLPNQHVYGTGKSGYGKSNLILSQAIQRIERGDGIAIIDPHGSLIKDGILPRIPKHRIDDVVYFNSGDYQYPMAINPLVHSGTKLEKEHIRVDLLNFFEDLFEAPLGVNIQHALNFLIITLLTRQDSTLCDIERLMIDKNWRNKFLQGITDDRIQMFWESEFPFLERRGIVTSISNKLSPLILPDSAIAPMLGQRENKIDFLEIMDSKKILLCNLSHGDIGKRNSLLLGKLLVSKIQIAAMMRKIEENCLDFYLYIDEFQHMACPSMADILSGARKFGLHLWLANQMIRDIPDPILRHVFNASTLIFFATDCPQDQMMIEKNLSRKFKAEDIGRLKRGETYVKMLNSVFNMTTERISDILAVHYTDDIIAASRKKYSLSEKDSFSYKKEKDQKPEVTLSIQEKTFLEFAFNNPALSVTKLYKEQGLSAYMGDKLKSSLKGKGIIHEIITHLGEGSRVAKFLIITPQGFNAFGKGTENSGKGGLLHKYFQSVIKSSVEGKGFRAVIEEPIPGNKEAVDIGLLRGGKKTAVEISVTTKTNQEVGNVQKSLQAGYDQIVILFLEENKMTEFQNIVKDVFTEKEQYKISIGLVYDFCRFL